MSAPLVDGMYIYRGGKWITVSLDSPEAKELNQRYPVRFDEVKFFYANIIDYGRVLLGCIAAITMMYDSLALLTAFLIIGSHLLDWVDGPVARKYGQCCIFGSGIDWLADVQAQIIAAIWLCSLDITHAPWLGLAVTIEMATCIYDYALTVSGRYPLVKAKYDNPFFKILEWATPQANYTHLGIVLWLAYPCFVCFKSISLTWARHQVHDPCSGITLFLMSLIEYSLIVPTFMYLWNEAAQCAIVLQTWAEPARKVKSDE